MNLYIFAVSTHYVSNIKYFFIEQSRQKSILKHQSLSCLVTSLEGLLFYFHFSKERFFFLNGWRSCDAKIMFNMIWSGEICGWAYPPPLMACVKCYGVRWSRSLLVLTLWTYTAFSWVLCLPSSPCHNKHHMFTRQYIGFLTHIPAKVASF